MANTIRSGVLLAMLFAILFGLAYAGVLLFELSQGGWLDLAGAAQRAAPRLQQMAPYIVVIGGGWAALSFVLNHMLISKASGSHIVPKGRLPQIEQMLERLCARAKMPVPRLAIIETDEMNAYASGISEDDYTVTLTTGLMRRLNADEIEAVIAHELTHIKNRDVRLMVIAATVTGGIALVFEMLFFVVQHGVGFALASTIGDGDDDGDGEGGVLSGWIAMILFLPLLFVAWLIGQLTNLAISRTREYMADAGAAELTGRTDTIVSALRKLEDDCDIGAPSGVMRMCIQSPEPFFNLLSTHPTTEQRAQALAAVRPVPVASPAYAQRGLRSASIDAPRLARLGAQPVPAGMKARASFGQRR